MSKKLSTTLSLVVSLVLFSTLALAQGSGSTVKNDKSKNKKHHSRLSKVEFWRHHKSSNGHATQDEAKKAKSTQPQPKSPQLKPVSFKKKPKRELHAKKMSKGRTSKASAHMDTRSKTAVKKRTAKAHSLAKSHPTAKKTKPPQKAQDRTTASLDQ